MRSATSLFQRTSTPIRRQLSCFLWQLPLDRLRHSSNRRPPYRTWLFSMSLRHRCSLTLGGSHKSNSQVEICKGKWLHICRTYTCHSLHRCSPSLCSHWFMQSSRVTRSRESLCAGTSWRVEWEWSRWLLFRLQHWIVWSCCLQPCKEGRGARER